MFEKVLIANRGEIALRIHRACQELGLKTVAIYSTADADAMHVRLADEAVCIGPAPVKDSYLNIPAVLSAAIITGADAIHPGYGFLSENADFVDMVTEHGFTFIGPKADHIRVMGDKITAKKTAKDLGIPVVPGSDGEVATLDQARSVAEEIGYPVLIKAAGGGGGKGMKVARTAADLDEAYTLARAESGHSFNNDTVYIEKYLDKPRHIEFQIVADQHGNVVHLGERDCSLQRSHQKVLEEAPSPALNDHERETMGKTVVQAMQKLGYESLGTIEFLYEDGEFYFIEMNTRLQVEHPITEMIYGIDIVREQIRIANGGEMSLKQENIKSHGHSIECRINAEDPLTFIPSPGKVGLYHPPGGLGVRVDSSVYTGYTIQPFYDSMVAKLIVHGHSRNECLLRLRRALLELVITDISTTTELHQKLIQDQDFINGDYDIHWLENFVENQKKKAA